MRAWFLFLFTLTACASGAEAPDEVEIDEVLALTPDFDNGDAVYAASCAACHAADGTGGTGPSFVAAFETFHDQGGSWEIEVRQWIAAILTGVDGTAMPGWQGELSAQEVADVIDYIHLSWGM
jgi:mono/diheme cytochrome c family protein